MMKNIFGALLVFVCVVANAAEFDIPYNQRRADGTNQAKLLTPGVSQIVTTNASRELTTTAASGLGFLMSANNLSDLPNAATARGNLGGTTVGQNFFTKANPGAITFPRANADNSVDLLNAFDFRSAIGAGTGTGDVVGPASATNNAVAVYDGATGKLVKNSTVFISSGNVLATSFETVTNGTGHIFIDSGGIDFYLGSPGTLAGTIVHPASGGPWTWTLPSASGTFMLGTIQSNLDSISSTWGAILYRATGAWAALAPGTSGSVLTSNGASADPSWNLIPTTKAWVNFDGTTADNDGGTYSRTSPSTTLTVTMTGHGYSVGHVVYCDFTTGTGVDGLYTITNVPTLDTFTITTVASTTTSGDVTLLRRMIRGNYNIHSVTYHNTVGRYTVNFLVALADANYAVTGTAGNTGMANPQVLSYGGITFTDKAVDILTGNLTPTPANVDQISVNVTR
jgi:hypothetical protein